nr:unnamed protein product [Callosobruchus analis]
MYSCNLSSNKHYIALYYRDEGFPLSKNHLRPYCGSNLSCEKKITLDDEGLGDMLNVHLIYQLIGEYSTYRLTQTLILPRI